jgi:hypothetical protein
MGQQKTYRDKGISFEIFIASKDSSPVPLEIEQYLDVELRNLIRKMNRKIGDRLEIVYQIQGIL